jgi:hypothetical protein
MVAVRSQALCFFWSWPLAIQHILHVDRCLVAHHVDGHVVDEERNVGPLIGIEAAEKLLICPANGRFGLNQERKRSAAQRASTLVQ